jgi:hypothetical protein
MNSELTKIMENWYWDRYYNITLLGIEALQKAIEDKFILTMKEVKDAKIKS